MVIMHYLITATIWHGTSFRNMTKQVLGAPLGFFESTPVGRLIQRFSKDLDQIDQQLPSSLGQVSSSIIDFFCVF